MKRTITVLVSLILMMLLFACSEKDDNPTDVNVYGYRLGQFVNQATIAALVDSAADSLDLRDLFAYEIIASDGWSPRQSVNAGYDLNWTLLNDCFLVPSDNNRVWHFNAELPSAYKVRDVLEFRAYRKIDVDTGRGKQMVELKGLQIQQIENWDGNLEDAVKLSDLLQGVSAYDSLSIVCYDGYGSDKYYQAEAVNLGYYLLESERTIFPGANIPNNQKKMKKVESIQLYGAVPAEHSFANAERTTADLIIPRPTSMTGFESTIMPTGE